MKPKILNWKSIESQFDDTIIIGNGGSIAICNKFNYKSLKQYAENNKIFSEKIIKLFDKFDTDDFESILRTLFIAKDINRILEILDDKTYKLYQELRTNLIETIRQIHPEYSDIETSLYNINNFIKRFKIILSLNYDLIIYWAIMYSIENDKQYRFKDFFIHGKFDIEFLLEEITIYKPNKHLQTKNSFIFYPHGNLILETNYENEKKINVSKSSNLLEEITHKWEKDNINPLFISEGSSVKKLQAIYNSKYLRTVYEKILPLKKKSLVIYGCSFADNDLHILEKILEFANKFEYYDKKFDGYPKIAISVYQEDIQYCIRIKQKIDNILQNKEVEIIFFDSQSLGCWAY